MPTFFSKKVSFQSIESLVRGRSRLRKRRAEMPVFFEKNSEKRHDNHIKRGYETDLADVKIVESVLLKIAADKKRYAAADAADNNVF